MLTEAQVDQFESNGMLVLPKFLPEDQLKTSLKVIDGLQGDVAYTSKGRWDMRNCLPHHEIFTNLATDEKLLSTVEQLLSFNVKLLGSHIVKMKCASEANKLTVDWHRDGGTLSVELEEPLPPMFVKAAFCVSGSTEAESGELLVVPGSHRLVGELPLNTEAQQPFGATRVTMSPGDLMIFDWRLWHAVSPNKSQVVRRTLYLAYGFRWLAPMDYVQMPSDLMEKSPVHRQILGGKSSQLGHYLPTEEDVPLQALSLDD